MLLIRYVWVNEWVSVQQPSPCCCWFDVVDLDVVVCLSRLQNCAECEHVRRSAASPFSKQPDWQARRCLIKHESSWSSSSHLYNPSIAVLRISFSLSLILSRLHSPFYNRLPTLSCPVLCFAHLVQLCESLFVVVCLFVCWFPQPKLKRIQSWCGTSAAGYDKLSRSLSLPSWPLMSPTLWILPRLHMKVACFSIPISSLLTRALVNKCNRFQISRFHNLQRSSVIPAMRHICDMLIVSFSTMRSRAQMWVCVMEWPGSMGLCPSPTLSHTLQLLQARFHLSFFSSLYMANFWTPWV